MSDPRPAPSPAPGLPQPDDALPDAVTGDTNDALLAGHTYDGIREYDNPMPGWWTTLFWVCVLFAPIYMLGVHVFGYMDTYRTTSPRARPSSPPARRRGSPAAPPSRPTRGRSSATSTTR